MKPRLNQKAGYIVAIISIVLTAAAIAVLPAAENVSGNWDLKVETPNGTATPSISLKQQGERLSGTYKGRMGETSLEGTIQNDGSVRFSVTLKFQDQEFLVTYSGKAEGDVMSGSVQFGNSSSGKWSARRNNAAK